jgi:hypothetical protein
MQTDAWIQIFVRALPAIAVFVLGFVAAADRKSRERWGNLLYQVGSIRPDQREDTKIGSGVKWPFFVVALFLLWWPFSYYRIATRGFEVKSDIYSKPQRPTIYDQGTTNSATNSATTNVATNATTSAPAPAPNSTPARGTNIYGQPR